MHGFGVKLLVPMTMWLVTDDAGVVGKNFVLDAVARGLSKTIPALVPVTASGSPRLPVNWLVHVWIPAPCTAISTCLCRIGVRVADRDALNEVFL